MTEGGEMWLFADGTEGLTTAGAVLSIVLTALGSGGIGALIFKGVAKYIDTSKEIKIKRLEQQERKWQYEKEQREKDEAERKEAANWLHAELKHIAEMARTETKQAQSQYAEKCVRVATLEMRIVELEKQLGAK